MSQVDHRKVIFPPWILVLSSFLILQIFEDRCEDKDINHFDMLAASHFAVIIRVSQVTPR